MKSLSTTCHCSNYPKSDDPCVVFVKQFEDLINENLGPKTKIHIYFSFDIDMYIVPIMYMCFTANLCFGMAYMS